MKKIIRSKTADFSRWQIEAYVPALVTWLYHKTAANASRLYRKRFGVGLAEWRIIAYLGIHGKGTNAEICDYIGLDKAAVSRSIASLKSRCYLVTRPRNGRDIEVRLTPQGLRLGNRILAAALDIEETLMHGISATDRRALVKTMTVMLRNLARVRRIVDDPHA